jgi:hypothetical protein
MHCARLPVCPHGGTHLDGFDFLPLYDDQMIEFVWNFLNSNRQKTHKMREIIMSSLSAKTAKYMLRSLKTVAQTVAQIGSLQIRSGKKTVKRPAGQSNRKSVQNRIAAATLTPLPI